MPLVRAYIALGSNLGDRLGQMQSALVRLAGDECLQVVQVSPVYENRAVGMGAVDDFLNAIAEVETSLAPLELLDRCLAVETELGRVRTGQWAPRTIDLDVIAYGEATIECERLHVPHPRIAERDFVVHPLHAIAPELRIRGQRVADLAATLSKEGLTLHPLSLNA
ncbi:2-amino-4-hydroxy-6-hydroxymethyldihydropteridine diphosphokinase [Coraliomargarita algicola]|uniref:2-amino-4-hydroxy-6-hydroxymethyldihydropteridine pyrophosphokinase n=1 Tax=Coraliomargarita algicola TaxID=3092156 RepID=A0ABZ0RN16_9BACT|nr:2-amino-4-hydroxy-6-hydroxymethyldihydropteridine diphosphokinase [Coraliomargarita sp. J2-16]WPJ97620.1 2-amino-4-hydroxy-6-hydroxymethyldihydropteridine diphosphokinase [Coraliomargarita sp. J2-16]